MGKSFEIQAVTRAARRRVFLRWLHVRERFGERELSRRYDSSAVERRDKLCSPATRRAFTRRTLAIRRGPPTADLRTAVRAVGVRVPARRGHSAPRAVDLRAVSGRSEQGELRPKLAGGWAIARARWAGRNAPKNRLARAERTQMPVSTVRRAKLVPVLLCGGVGE